MLVLLDLESQRFLPGCQIFLLPSTCARETTHDRICNFWWFLHDTPPNLRNISHARLVHSNLPPHKETWVECQLSTFFYQKQMRSFIKGLATQL
jgi:hypothetical protein